MKNVIITQLKDQSNRISDWILYHNDEGFDTFIIFDDKSQDDTLEKIRDIKEIHGINIIVMDTDSRGNIYSSDQCKDSESYHGDGSLNDRIKRSFTRGNEIVKEINPEAICAFIDVDEFLVSERDEPIADIINEQISKRGIDQLVINSFDVYDSGYEIGDWYTTSAETNLKWDESEFKRMNILRYKSLVISGKMKDVVHVHYLRNIEGLPESSELQDLIDSKYRISDDVLRIHHFRKPNINMFDISFSEDNTLIDRISKLRNKIENER